MPVTISPKICSGWPVPPVMFSGTPTWPVMPENTSFLSRRSAKFIGEVCRKSEGRRFAWLRSSVVKTDTSCDGSSTGSGFSSTAFTSVKIVVFAPMPSASDSAAITVNPGVFASRRAPNFRS